MRSDSYPPGNESALDHQLSTAYEPNLRLPQFQELSTAQVVHPEKQSASLSQANQLAMCKHIMKLQSQKALDRQLSVNASGHER
jgi:hypothetical protein